MSRPARDTLELPKPLDIHHALAEAVTLIRQAGDEYALIGGVALSAYGIERFTKNVDLACTITQTAAARRSVPDARDLRIGGIVINTSVGVRVDLIDRRFAYRELFEEAIYQAKTKGPLVRAETVELPVVPLPHLVAMKLIADRPQDESDLVTMLRLETIDYAAARNVVERWVGPYAAGRLDKLARIASRNDAPEELE